MNVNPIGYMDSGVGGLTVVKEALRQLPNESVVFLGDQGRLPYGPRDANEVRRFSEQIARFELQFDIKMFVIACNTATAAALPDLQAKMDIPVVGVIAPGSRAAVSATKNHQIAVLATDGTTKSGAYPEMIAQMDAKAGVVGLGCPDFVPLVESGKYLKPVAQTIVDAGLDPLATSQVDTVVLGCTHYPLLAPQIQRFFGKGVTLIDAGKETVKTITALLDYYQLASPRKGRPNRYFTTGSVVDFNQLAAEWMPEEHVSAQAVAVSELEAQI
ncbi:glutamate racemase [Levilactobacillus bambusae]|uniref:Glutamate racemase n=2 Tax=Levilactobacillus bambusae TaxID=2024736 RepID=A0A2V1MWZ0_9LACO|nr:glutamate racemase [Levilactobacillus bambusae]PWF99593.1 glutamate racemase [Levilactobacillus bambusae]